MQRLTTSMQRATILGIGLVVAIPLLATPATAQTRIFVDCPNGLPCQTEVTGHIDAFGNATIPWVVSVAVPAGICFSYESEGADAGELFTIVGPDGRVYQPPLNDEESGIGIISPTSIGGWYTVQVDSQAPALEQIFKLLLSFDPASACPNPNLTGR